MKTTKTAELVILECIRREQGIFRLGASLSGMIKWFDAYDRSCPSALELQNLLARLEAAEYVRLRFGRIRLTKKFFRKHSEIRKVYPQISTYESCQAILETIEGLNPEGSKSEFDEMVTEARWKKALMNYGASH
ncbi:hypothetical protein [Phaeocystidibacter luteus]|uniref:Uncharacterized protein n=1 Tax=Phaeocystidibacter luteus TaxID=911197 RepID=A0A6N6RES7_9FLAO|nr:hypothetical protein [Phaeocystidibacter luteus]KAB2805373.1 hypothetical protein F8C67_13645 [Phaeocystidibacter luteus]